VLEANLLTPSRSPSAYIGLVHILVVEDQDAIRRMIEALVGARGYGVTAVSTGSRAIDVATSEPPDLVLLDLMLPGQYDGFAVCDRLRNDPVTAHIPIVIISALDDETSRARAAAAGATAYYTKPFSPIALLKEIERLKSVGHHS
jgi:CheY-like chemotaxis protein